jgi:hypothetical protein
MMTTNRHICLDKPLYGCCDLKVSSFVHVFIVIGFLELVIQVQDFPILSCCVDSSDVLKLLIDGTLVIAWVSVSMDNIQDDAYL